MECAEQKLRDREEYLSQFILKARELRIPLSGSMEVTYRCNLRCVHCYLGSRTSGRNPEGSEMSTSRVLSLIDEVAEAGCLNLVLTGGEPLLHADFPVIYRHAKRRGLLVTVFSNGTLVREGTIELFREFPPLEIEISLYGATAGTYERVTGVPGSYEKCLCGIRSLVDAGINVNLKTILMTLNRHELSAMEEIARKFGARFRFDAAISPGVGGDKGPLALRVPPEEAVELEFSDAGRARRWEEFLEESRDRKLDDCLYGCGAGVTGFHIDPGGGLQPCLMTYDVRYDLEGRGFMAGWNDIIYRLKDRKVPADFPCRSCRKINLCGYCPAFFRLEKGREDVPSEYVCEMGDLRYRHIRRGSKEGDDDEERSGREVQATL